MSRGGGGFRGRGRGRGGGGGGGGGGRAGDVPMGALTWSDLAAVARESAKASEALLFDPTVELPETAEADETERREAQWGVRLAMGTGVGTSGSFRRGKFWVDVPQQLADDNGGGKGQASIRTGSEPWLYSERYKAHPSSTAVSLSTAPTTTTYPLLDPAERALLDKAFFPPDLWAGYFEGKADRRRRPPINGGGVDGTTDEEGSLLKKKRREGIGELVDQMAQDPKDGRREQPDEGDVPEPRDEEEEEEEDPDYDNNYFDNGEDDELGSDGVGDEGGVFD